MKNRVADAANALAELAGATIAWSDYFVAHSVLILNASGGQRGDAELIFEGTLYIDLPVHLHNAKLAIGSDADVQALRTYIPPEMTNSLMLRKEHTLVLEGIEGRFYVWTAMFGVRWLHKDGASDKTWMRNAVHAFWQREISEVLP